MNCRKANPKAIHICNSHEPTLAQKLQKSMSCQRTVKMKLVANLKDKMIENKECQWVTKAIRNAGKVLYMNIVAINEISSKLKVWYFKIPHYA